MTYQFVQVQPAGEVFAVAFDQDGQAVYGVCGPLHHSERKEEELPNYDYKTEDAEWMAGLMDQGDVQPYEGKG
jgi:hypothetical protein